MLEVQELESDEAIIGGFDFVNMLEVGKLVEYLPWYFDQYTNPTVADMMRKMGFFPGMGLARQLQGIPESLNFINQ